MTGVVRLQREQEENAMEQALQLVPFNIIVTDERGTITFLNKLSLSSFISLGEHLSEMRGRKVGALFGGMDILRPGRHVCQVGQENLELSVQDVSEEQMGYKGFIIAWEMATDKLKEQEQMIRAVQMVDLSPINTIMSDPEGTLIYMNESSAATLRKVQEHLPEKVENLLGKSIDMFHADPAYQQGLIKDPGNFPRRRTVEVGGEKLALTIVPILNKEGKYLGPMVTWSVVTEKVKFYEDLKKAVNKLTDASVDLVKTSNNLSSSAEVTSGQAKTANTTSMDLNAGAQAMKSNIEKMVVAIKEVARMTGESSNVSGKAMKMTKSANESISRLGKSSGDIGNVIKLISSVAQQTNLLALNAAIEAARAGEAGKGFAVVASEVKELSKQTAQATQDVTAMIETIQAETKEAIDAIGKISKDIEEVNAYAKNIANSVRLQEASTDQVANIITKSVEGVRHISENIGAVSQYAQNTGKEAANTLDSASNLGDLAKILDDYVNKLEV